MEPSLNYYTTQGSMSEAGEYGWLFEGLPASLAEVVRVVQESTVHVFWAERYGLKLSPEREAEVQLRSMRRRLQRMLEIDPRPLTQPRPLEKKLVGNCRDFTLLLVSHTAPPGRPGARPLRVRGLLPARSLRRPLGRRGVGR